MLKVEWSVLNSTQVKTDTVATTCETYTSNTNYSILENFNVEFLNAHGEAELKSLCGFERQLHGVPERLSAEHRNYLEGMLSGRQISQQVRTVAYGYR